MSYKKFAAEKNCKKMDIDGYNELCQQLENDRSCYNEPYAYLTLKSGRAMTIILNQHDLPEEQWYYSIDLYCSEDETDAEYQNSAKGIIKTLISRNVNIIPWKEVKEILDFYKDEIELEEQEKDWTGRTFTGIYGLDSGEQYRILEEPKTTSLDGTKEIKAKNLSTNEILSFTLEELTSSIYYKLDDI